MIKREYIATYYLPIEKVFQIVPITANRRMVPRLLKKSRFGIKYPASKIMGGSIKWKKVLGVSGDTCTLCVWNSSSPITSPTKISRHDSGKM